ncbi:MAG TPA: S-layer family protein, partial [Coleofasciculaceae cyanobacterium]
LNTGVLVALENSDIATDSADFRGGNVTITTQAIFGTEFRPTRTPNSDITASGRDSTLNGTVQINLIGIDPSRGLTNLPTDVTDASNQIVQDCQSSGGKASSSFINTGRGGLPTNPYDPLSSSDLLADVQPPTQWEENSESAPSSSTLPRTAPKQIVEARGWMINENGEVVLVAEVPSSSSNWGCHLR